MALCEAPLARHEGSKVEKGRVDLSHKMKRKDASGQSLTLSLSCFSVVLLNKKNYYITLLDDGTSFIGVHPMNAYIGRTN